MIPSLNELLDMAMPLPWSGCFIWMRAATRDGYGVIKINGKQEYVHRLVLKLDGRLPDSMYGLHSCDTPSCINPAHLYAGTQLDNIYDAIDRNRWPKTHKKTRTRPIGQCARCGETPPPEEMMKAGIYCKRCHREYCNARKYWRQS